MREAIEKFSKMSDHESVATSLLRQQTSFRIVVSRDERRAVVNVVGCCHSLRERAERRAAVPEAS
jgi:hypothetical protein